MTMSGTTWTRTLTLPTSGGPLTPEGVAEELMPWLADNTTGKISARDLRNSFDLVISLFGDAGISPFDPTKAYKQNDLVTVLTGAAPNQTVQIFGATAAIPASATVPGTAGADPNWKPIVSPTVVATSTTVGETPAAPGTTTLPPLVSGNVFLNTADNAAWIYDGAVWQQVPTGVPTVTVSNSPGVVPANPGPTQSLHTFPAGYTPKAGDFFINTNDEDHYLFDGVNWQVMSSPPVQIAISRTAGDNPAMQPPSWAPRIGDLYINDTDDAVWVWAVGGGAAQAPNADWQPMTSAAGSAFVTDTPGDVPDATFVTGGNQHAYSFPRTHTLAEGDRLVNRADHISWVYARNPLAAQPGQNPLVWVEIPTQNTAVVSITPGEVPENPATGQTAYTFAVPPRIGDIFVNRVDAKTWVRAADPTGGGGPDFWEPLPSTAVTVSQNAGDTPGSFAWPAGASHNPGDVFINHPDRGVWVAWDNAGSIDWERTSVEGPSFTIATDAGDVPVAAGQATASGNVTMPATTEFGDLFVNTTDDLEWVAVPDSGGQPVWQLIGAPPEQVTVSQTAGETPTQPGATVMPATSRPGDVFINVPDRGTWTAFDNNGVLDWQRASVEGPQFTISQTAGETPTAPGTTTMPTTTEYGDIFVNHADTHAWVAVPDAAGTGAEWQLIGHPTANVTVTDTAADTPPDPTVVQVNVGDVFINRATGLTAIYGEDPQNAGQFIWVALPTPAVFVTDTTGETPQAPGTTTLPATIIEGSIFNNVADGKLWVYQDDPKNPGNLAWQATADAERNAVVILTTSGDAPTPPAAGDKVPAVGDIVYNSVDEDLWIWGLTPGTQNYNWQPLRQVSGLVFVSDTANEVPANPGTGQTVFDFAAYIAAHHPGHTLQEGDRYINRADHESWVYTDDPASPGNLIWVAVPSDNHAWVSHTTAEDPASYTFQPAPRVGDVFYNDADNKLWLYALNPTTNLMVWNPIKLSATFSTAVAGEDPTSLSAATVLHPGDHFVNVTDGTTWVAIDDPANRGTIIWQMVAAKQAITVSQTAYEHPLAPGTTQMPATTKFGDLFVNHADEKAWVAIPDAAGTGVEWQQIAHPEQQVTVSDVAGEAPPNAGGNVGDVFVNIIDGRAWVFGTNPTNLIQNAWKPLTYPVREYNPLVAYLEGELVADANGDVWIAKADTTARAQGTTVDQVPEFSLVGDDRPNVTVTDVGADTPITHIHSMGTWTLEAANQPAAVPDGQIQLRSPGQNAALVMHHNDNTGADRTSELGTLQIGDVVRVRDASYQNGWDVTVSATPTTITNTLPATGDVLVINGASTVVGTAPPDGAVLRVAIPSTDVVAKRDDVFINTVDGKSWVYADDDGTGQPGWVDFGGAAADRPQVTVTTLEGGTPTKGGWGSIFGNIPHTPEWTAITNTAIRIGQAHVEPGTGVVHLSGTDKNNTSMAGYFQMIQSRVGERIRVIAENSGKHIEFEVQSMSFAGGNITITPVTAAPNPFQGGDTFTVLATQPAPTLTPKRDDVYVNTHDGISWVYADDDGTGAPGWVEIGSDRPHVTLTDVAGKTPTVDHPTLVARNNTESLAFDASHTEHLVAFVSGHKVSVAAVTYPSGVRTVAALPSLPSYSLAANQQVDVSHVLGPTESVGVGNGAIMLLANGDLGYVHRVNAASPVNPVTIEHAADVPSFVHAVTPATAAHRDDEFINTRDKRSWVYADDDGTGVPGWVERPAAAESKFVAISHGGTGDSISENELVNPAVFTPGSIGIAASAFTLPTLPTGYTVAGAASGNELPMGSVVNLDGTVYRVWKAPIQETDVIFDSEAGNLTSGFTRTFTLDPVRYREYQLDVVAHGQSFLFPDHNGTANYSYNFNEISDDGGGYDVVNRQGTHNAGTYEIVFARQAPSDFYAVRITFTRMPSGAPNRWVARLTGHDSTGKSAQGVWWFDGDTPTIGFGSIQGQVGQYTGILTATR